MSRKVQNDGKGQLVIRFPFDRLLVDRIKTLPRRRWDAIQRVWTVPESDLELLTECLKGQGFTFDMETPTSSGEVEVDDSGWTVSGLNEAVRTALQRAFPTSVWLVGEISGFNKSRHRRHVGFELVEREENGNTRSKIPATLFERGRQEIERALAAAGDPFKLEDEIVVRVQVRIELYVPWGQYRVTVEGLDVQYTLGEAARRREETIRRLGERGLLERNDRLEVAAVPLRVGLITSLNSDAYNDVLRTLRESGFAFDVTVHGARVQGRSTEPSVLNALDWFRERAEQFDTILICRGGGSRTDLVWFDTEPLGAAVATFPLPVLIGIGHEQDLSVLDAVARSYKTPTATAAWLVDQVAEALDSVERTAAQLLKLAGSRIESTRERLVTTRQRLLIAGGIQLRRERTSLRHFALRIPGAAGLHIRHQTHTVIENRRRIAPVGRRLLAHTTATLEARARQLHSVDPRRVVERGYAVLRGMDGKVVTRVKTAPAGTEMTAELKDGRMLIRSEGPLGAQAEDT